MKLLDLFAGAQGCGVGYARAGFVVTCVDIEPHERHPMIQEFIAADAPRLFESNAPLMAYRAPRVANPVGVYGKLDGRRLWTRGDGTEQRAARSIEEAQVAMGIDWMAWDDLTEAIPPNYTEWIGTQLIDQLTLTHGGIND